MKVDFGELKNIFGESNVFTEPADLYVYGADASVHYRMADAVVRATNIEQISKLLQYANAEKIPIIPRGGASGMSGHTVPIDGGIVLDMKLMNRIIEINPQNMYCRAEAGVITDDLTRALQPYGMFLPAVPESSRIATIGGNIANNASGVRSVKYGSTRDYVLGLKVVLANGNVVNLGATTKVEAGGYQLHRLIVGSEGTLAIIAEATIRFAPLPKFICLGMATFEKLEEAGTTIGDVLSSGCEPSVLELMDDIAIKAVNTTTKMGLPEVAAIVFFEADGKVKEAVEYEIQNIKKVCEKNNGKVVSMSYDAKEREKIYSGRKKLFPSLSRYKEGFACTSLADDMAVPYSKMAECARKIRDISEKYGIIMTAYGHCGGGVMHTKILMDANRKDHWEAAKKAVEEIYDYVDSVNGITSGEHGIAISKAPSWKKSHQEQVRLMSGIKRALDPNNILNPYKIMDAPDDWFTATSIRYLIYR